jgi:hypothetical protein
MVAEAVALLRRGLALVPAVPDAGRRRETELDLQIAFGRALISNRGWGAPQLGEVYSLARELAAEVNRPRAVLDALWGQFMHHCARPDLQRARRLATEMRELGAAGDLVACVKFCKLIVVSGEKLLLCQSRP